MIAHGQAAMDLDTFRTSEKMQEIQDIIQASKQEGNVATIFAYEYLGSSRETIFISTLLRLEGYEIEHRLDMMIVKEEKMNAVERVYR